ncbi:MAG: hypothetical protein ACLQUY_23020 [Ktedonobacterales bacterium]
MAHRRIQVLLDPVGGMPTVFGILLQRCLGAAPRPPRGMTRPRRRERQLPRQRRQFPALARWVRLPPLATGTVGQRFQQSERGGCDG